MLILCSTIRISISLLSDHVPCNLYLVTYYLLNNNGCSSKNYFMKELLTWIRQHTSIEGHLPKTATKLRADFLRQQGLRFAGARVHRMNRGTRLRILETQILSRRTQDMLRLKLLRLRFIFIGRLYLRLHF